MALSVFGSMITRASGQLVRTSSSRGTFTPWPRNAGDVVAGVGLLDLGDRERLDRAAAVGRPVEPVVVERDDHAVLRDVGVGLQVRAPLLDGDRERLERVLRRVAGGTAVGDHDRRRGVEEGMQGADATARSQRSYENRSRPPVYVERSGAREAEPLVGGGERVDTGPAVDPQLLCVVRPGEVRGVVAQARTDTAVAVRGGGQQDLHVELGDGRRRDVVVRVAEDDRAGVGVAVDLEPEPAGRRPAVRPLDVLRPRRERLAAPLSGLSARHEPRDRVVEQREQPPGIGGGPLLDRHAPQASDAAR